MNKEKFLMELREYISILENQEQKDILAEYAQHIDMKMQKGLSEEEAIRDFGPMQELASQILEAYHVKPEFGRKGKGLRLPARGMRKSGGGELFLGHCLRWLRKTAAGTIHGIGRSFRWLGEKGQMAARWFGKPFTRRQERRGLPETAKENEMKEKEMNIEETRKEKGRAAAVGKAAVHGIIKLYEWLAEFVLFCLRLMWNAGWLVFSVFCACMAMIVLSGAGAIIVFLLQGYPLIGIFMICLGGLLCFGALSCGAFSMLIKKEKDNGSEGSDKTDEEVRYEQTA